MIFVKHLIIYLLYYTFILDTNVMFKQVQTKYFRSKLIKFGSGALPVNMLLISIFENNNKIVQVRLSKG